MRQSLYNTFLSSPRYNRYLAATTNSKSRAERLYNANIRLTQAFHPILSQFEIVLRNSINNVLTAYFSNPDWIITEKTGFMSNRSLASGGYQMRRIILGTETNLVRAGITATSGNIIASQTFGFWSSLFLAHHYSLIGGRPIQVFGHKPPSEDRASIHTKLEDIRKFRNRINHCEPICFNGNTIDCSNAEAVRDIIFDLVRWIEPDLEPFFKKIDNTKGKVKNIMSI